MPDITGTLRPPRLPTAGRPASPALGEMYFDTTTSTLYWWNGTTWVSASGGVPPIGAWQTVALQSANGSWGGAVLKYVKDQIGFVHVHADTATWTLTTQMNSGATIATFPAGYRPGGTIYLPFFYAGTATEVMSLTTGGALQTSVNWTVTRTVRWTGFVPWLAEA